MGGMTGSLLLLLWAGVSVSTMMDLQKRIIGGKDCDKKDRLYHVKLNKTTRTGDTEFCGGSLISGWWILTARHCWEPDSGIEIKAILRVHPGGQEVREIIQKNNILQHPTADIMLLKLSKHRPDFPHIDLPNCVNQATPRNVMVQIAGHGAINAAPDGTRILAEKRHLKCANIRAIDCPPHYKMKHEQIFCGETTDVKNPVGGCLGDSGGGVVYNNRIYGVISNGNLTHACSDPDQYVDVCGYVTWITHNTAIKPPK